MLKMATDSLYIYIHICMYYIYIYLCIYVVFYSFLVCFMARSDDGKTCLLKVVKKLPGGLKKALPQKPPVSLKQSLEYH